MTSEVRTDEDPACDDDVSVDLPDDATAPTLARQVVRETLARWGLPELVDDAELAVSELVTNSFKHALPPVVLSLCRRPGSVRIDVSDMRPMTVSCELPLASQDTDESGRGRGIIEAVSHHSGTEDTEGPGDGKSSYASWDVEPQAPAPA